MAASRYSLWWMCLARRPRAAQPATVAAWQQGDTGDTMNVMVHGRASGCNLHVITTLVVSSRAMEVNLKQVQTRWVRAMAHLMQVGGVPAARSSYAKDCEIGRASCR